MSCLSSSRGSLGGGDESRLVEADLVSMVGFWLRFWLLGVSDWELAWVPTGVLNTPVILVVGYGELLFRVERRSMGEADLSVSESREAKGFSVSELVVCSDMRSNWPARRKKQKKESFRFMYFFPERLGLEDS